MISRHFGVIGAVEGKPRDVEARIDEIPAAPTVGMMRVAYPISRRIVKFTPFSLDFMLQIGATVEILPKIGALKPVKGKPSNFEVRIDEISAPPKVGMMKLAYPIFRRVTKFTPGVVDFIASAPVSLRGDVTHAWLAARGVSDAFQMHLQSRSAGSLRRWVAVRKAFLCSPTVDGNTVPKVAVVVLASPGSLPG